MKPRLRLKARVNEKLPRIAIHPKWNPRDGRRVATALAGDIARIKHIVAVVQWDDGSTQVVNNSMQMATMAYMVSRAQAAYQDELDGVTRE